MKLQPVSARLSRRIATLSAAGAGLLSLTALGSWWFGHWRLLAFGPDYVPMAPSTALLMLLVSIAAGLRAAAPSRAARVVESVCVTLVLLGGTLLGLRWLDQFTAPIETWLARTAETVGAIPLGQMSPLTAGCFIVIAVALLCGRQTAPHGRSLRSLGTWLSVAVLLLGGTTGAAYLTGTPFMYGSSAIPMAFLTGLSFALVGTAILLTIGWDIWPLRIFLRVPAAGSTDGSPRQIEWSLLLIMGGLTAGILTVGLRYVHQQHTSARAMAYAELSAIAELKVQQLVNWRTERLSDGLYFSQSLTVARDVARLLESPGDPEIEAEVLQWLTLLKGGQRYENVTVFDSQLNPRLSIPPRSISATYQPPAHLDEALHTNRVFLTDLLRYHPSDPALLHLVIPILPPGHLLDASLSTDASIRPLAVIDLEIDPHRFLFPLVHSWPMPSRTAEALLVRRDGHDVPHSNESRDQTHTGVSPPPALDDAQWTTIPPMRNQGDIRNEVDARGVRVVAVVRDIPETPWLMIAKVDEAELYAPMRQQARTAAAAVSTLLVAMMLGLTTISRRRNEQFLQTQLKAQGERHALAERYEHLMKFANDVVLLIGADSRILEANDRAIQSYGWTLPELQRMTLSDLNQPGSSTGALDHSLGIDTDEPALFQAVHCRKNGTAIPVEISANRIEINGTPFLLAIVRDSTQRKKAEEQLRQLSDRLQLATRVARIGIWDADLIQDRLIWDDAMYALYGVTSDQYGDAREAWHAGVHPEDRSRVDDQIQLTLDGGNEFESEFRVVWPDGSIHTIQASGWVQRDASGQPVRMLGTNSDITERKRAQTALSESEALFHSLVENLPQHVFRKDLAGRFTFGNGPFCKGLGKPLADILGKTDSDFFPPEVAARYRRDDQRVIDTGQPFEGEETFQQSDGQLISVNVLKTPLRDSAGQIVGIQGISWDITRRRQTEEELRKLSRAVEQSPVSVIITNPTGEIEYVNPKFIRVTGYSLDEVHGKTPSILKGGETPPEHYRDLWQTISRGGVWQGELHNRKKDGGLFWEHASISPILDDRGRITHYLGIKEDITERKQLQSELALSKAQLLQQQRLESVGTLAGGVAHEINNPINGIMNYAQIIQDRLEPQHPLAEYTGEIIHESHRVATIVRNLLIFSRTDRHSHSPARIGDIIDATLSLIRTVIRHDQITLTVDVPTDLPELRCRSQQIQQVLMNLMTNARDALNERYPGHDPDKFMNLRANQFEREGRRWLRLTVEDHGSGIPSRIRERMFDPFFTTKPRDKGTGLGLSISHGIVKEHHGTLTVESEPGQFTRMHLDLPVDLDPDA